MAVIDHLVLAVPDLDDAIADFEHAHGVRPAIGGRHAGLGTHNALVSFGDSYLELIAPDPTQPDPDRPRPFGVDDIDGPTLVTWAVRPDPAHGETIEKLIESCRAVGHEPGSAVAMSRQTPAGELLRWRLTFPTMTQDGLVPFLIDWGATRHPASGAPRGLALTAFGGATADADRANEILGAIGLPEFAAPIDGGGPGLFAEFDPTPEL
jgi:hypothetical protein